MSDNRTPEVLREGYLHSPTVSAVLDVLCEKLDELRGVTDGALTFAVESGNSPTDWVISVLRHVQGDWDTIFNGKDQ